MSTIPAGLVPDSQGTPAMTQVGPVVHAVLLDYDQGFAANRCEFIIDKYYFLVCMTDTSMATENITPKFTNKRCSFLVVELFFNEKMGEKQPTEQWPMSADSRWLFASGRPVWICPSVELWFASQQQMWHWKRKLYLFNYYLQQDKNVQTTQR